jgi:hypothetical protein
MNLRKDLNPSNVSGGRGALRNLRLSPVEMVFLAAALLYAGFVLYFYFSGVQPLSSRLTELQSRQQKLIADNAKSLKDEKARSDQAANAEKILDSLQSFQAMLKPDERGMTQILNEINSLSQTHKVLAGDASYRVTEAEATTDENGNPLPQKKLSEKKFNLYPTLGIDTTIVGDYPNLRRFLADLERSRQFLIINSLSFQGGDDKLARTMAKSGKQIQLSSPEAVPVSVKIELDTYFQAPGSALKQD